MSGRRALVLAILLYVTLDLSLPSMPGAFVFEPSGSVESTHGWRGRLADVAPATTLDPAAIALPRAESRLRVALPAPVVRDRDRVQPRGTLEPVPSSDDPH